ncbi:MULTISPECIES: hypothetical protein [Enterobacter cloacae complex]|uniref:hypothetical protein n=1 Tax=Enterobacter cloacae complex TaxID=354276 RepID=UPI0020051BCA|nr:MULTISPECIES: hypothetical protein [Enterobacter cloacae complex]ELD2091561.1 hypothetical protein [Enterobacter hormaechei]MCK7019061.1 hypothetical protein [Enterobacter kobei]MDV5404817.1 hypothetical protein [Enterobacter cloacae]HAV2178168.1 hypothetical protein [Enterobacter cloacae]HDC4449243.1 hypothetical protein [Enterobacter kobei]
MRDIKMKIEYKKPLLIVFCSMLAFIVSVVVIHHYNKDNFEWGNVSDWLSSLSTFGTLLVAYGAFIKAPDWLLQKRYEVSSHIINETVFTNLPKLSKLCVQYKIRHFIICKQLISCLNGKLLNEQKLRENRTKLDITFNELFTLITSMKNELRTVKRNQFDFSEYTHQIYNNLIEVASNYNAVDSEILYNIFDVMDFDLSDETDPQKYIDTIMSLKVRTTDLSNSFNEFARKIDEDNKPIEEFITPIKK